MSEAGHDSEFTDEIAGIFDFSFGDAFDDSEMVGEETLFCLIDDSVSTSSEFLTNN